MRSPGPIVVGPNGSHGSALVTEDLWGIALLRGTAEQIDSLRRSKDSGRNVLRVSLVADRVRVVDAMVDEGAAQGMNAWDQEIRALDSG